MKTKCIKTHKVFIESTGETFNKWFTVLEGVTGDAKMEKESQQVMIKLDDPLKTIIPIDTNKREWEIII